MLKVIDTITSDELLYEDIDEFQTVSKHAFDESVHDAIDALCEAYRQGQPMQEYEAYLGIKLA